MAPEVCLYIILLSHYPPMDILERGDLGGQVPCVCHTTCVWQRQTLKPHFPDPSLLFHHNRLPFQGKFSKGFIPSIKIIFFYSLSELRKIMYLYLLTRHCPWHWEPGNRAEKFLAVVSYCHTEECQ